MKQSGDIYYVEDGIRLCFGNGGEPRIATMPEASFWEEIVYLRKLNERLKERIKELEAKDVQ